MKKSILVFLTILSINQFVNAQDKVNDSANQLDIKFGAKAGLNLATLSGDLEGVSSRTSFHIGGMAEVMLNDEFAVQPELLYSSQGAKLDDGTLAFNYLNLPIMGKYFVSDEFTIEAGPQFGYLLSAKLKYDSEDNGGGGGSINAPARNAKINRVAETEDIKEDVKSFDYGLNIGASYIIENGINISLRYYLGLANGSNLDGDGEFKNSVFQLSIGYFFN